MIPYKSFLRAFYIILMAGPLKNYLVNFFFYKLQTLCAEQGFSPLCKAWDWLMKKVVGFDDPWQI